MDQTNSSVLSQLPPNLVENEDIKVFRHTASLLDKTFDDNFYSEVNKLKYLYNPSSDYYDPDYILDFLGASTLKNLLSDITDKVSLTMILGGIYNIKGTKAAFEAILKLIKLDYKQIVYTQQTNGCTQVTIIIDQASRIDIADVAQLIKFSKEVFPLCLTLNGVTNCVQYSNTLDYSGYSEITLGQHYLDRDFVLDLSRLDTSYGATVKSPDGTLNVLICNATYADQDLDTWLAGESVSIRNLTSLFSYQIAKYQRLDYEFTLDTQNNDDYYFFSTSIGTTKTHDMIYSGYAGVRFGVTQNVSQFRLDRDNLDRTMLRRLDGVQAYTYKRGLDYDFEIDSTPFGTDASPVTIHNTTITQRNIASDADSVVVTTASSSNIGITVSDGNMIVGIVTIDDRHGIVPPVALASNVSTLVGTIRIADVSLQFDKPRNSQYIPALTT